MAIEKKDTIQEIIGFVESQYSNNQSNQPHPNKEYQKDTSPYGYPFHALQKHDTSVFPSIFPITKINSVKVDFANEETQDLTQPRNILSPEGIWLPGAIRIFKRKHTSMEKTGQKAIEVTKKFMSFLYENLQIQLYIISGENGRKSILNRDFLSSAKCALHFTIGVMPADFGHAAYVFVNKEQFESALEKAFSESSNEPVGAIINNLMPVEKIEQKSKHKKRNHELHNCIGFVVNDLRVANDGINPSGAAAWSALKKRQKEFDCIKSIEKDEKSNDDVIRWISVNGTNQTMKKSRFLNVVSDYNSGKKTL